MTMSSPAVSMKTQALHLCQQLLDLVEEDSPTDNACFVEAKLMLDSLRHNYDLPDRLRLRLVEIGTWIEMLFARSERQVYTPKEIRTFIRGDLGVVQRVIEREMS